MAKKKRIPAEERKEYKGGKYMGGPAEEKAEKKGKRMAMGGPAMVGPVPDGSAMMGRDYSSGGDMGVMRNRMAPRFPRPQMGDGMSFAGGMTKPALNKGPVPMMRGGGLARKGIGQALAGGGMVRGCGVVERGKTRGKMV